MDAETKAKRNSQRARAAGDRAIRIALRVLEGRLRERGPLLGSPEVVRDYVRLRVAALEHEVFVVLFVDSQHRLIACDELFRGTLAQTSVYPREVVKGRWRATPRRWSSPTTTRRASRSPAAPTSC